MLIDGSYGEGGGAILRNSLALSILTRKPFTINNLRINRQNPGLKAQHLSAVLAGQQLCEATVEGASLGAKTLKFAPKHLEPQTISIDIGTAGSITLMLQALLLPSLFAADKIHLKIKGGTDTKWSMPIDYFCNVFLQHINHLASIRTQVVERGYYPIGGGKVDITIVPKYHIKDTSLHEFMAILRNTEHAFNNLHLGDLVSITGISHATKNLQEAQVAERQIIGAKHALSQQNCALKFKAEYNQAMGKGSGLCLWAKFNSGAIIGADALGASGKRAEIVGQEAAANLLEQISKAAPVDKYLADQLIPYLALIGGSYKATEITKHTLTNIHVVNQFINDSVKLTHNTISAAQYPS
ncbi:MAG: RNA 3'-terminal phosphate cyclase [Candidatus Woesearchaeota archaeon]